MTAFIASLVACGASLGPGPAGDGDAVHFVDASVEPGGELLGGRFRDVDGDGRPELCLAVEVAGERELRFHRVRAQRIDPEPFRAVIVKDDVIAYAFADVRPEAGDELLFLTKDGLYSYSLQKDGYRGNIAPLVRAELLYDVPDPERLPEWRFVVPSQWGDRVVVPERAGVSIWGRKGGRAAAEATYDALADFPIPVTTTGTQGTSHDDLDEGQGERRGRSRETRFTVGSSGIRFHVSHDADTLLLPGDDDEPFRLLSSERSYGAPALTDVDRDGNPDLLFVDGREIRVHLSRAGGFSDVPDRIEAYPEYLTDEEARPRLRLSDLDGDGDADILARKSEGEGDFENVETTLLVLINDGERLLPAEPDQVLRFHAAALRVELTDVDGDGRLDLALRKFELPGLLESVTGFEFVLTHLVFLGQSRGTPFERKPALRHARSYDESSLQDVIANRRLEMDCDGDGIADLVEVDLQGRITIRRLRRTSGFFAGDSWSIESSPWKRFEVFGNVDSVSVEDVNGDGVGDVVSRGSRSMTVLLSGRR